MERKQDSEREVTEAVQRPDYDITDLVNRITAKNRHEEVDFGGPVGKEVW
jgi:antitoxin component of MazEF toxin-antitoxin module